MEAMLNINIIRSQIYLYSILPALVEFINADLESRAMIAALDLCLCIKIMGQPAVAIEMRHGNAIFHPNFCGRSKINLLFITPRHLCAFFDGNNFKPPLVTSGCWRINCMRIFSQLTNKLSMILQGSPAATPMYTRLAFLVAGLSLSSLANFDPVSRNILNQIPHRVAEFVIDDADIQPIWFSSKNDVYQVGRGHSICVPDVTIRFADMKIANLALCSQIDTMAAIGARKIIIEGYVPLAERLGIVMERFDFFMKPGLV